jgi:hypothetical protein
MMINYAVSDPKSQRPDAFLVGPSLVGPSLGSRFLVSPFGRRFLDRLGH